MVIQATVTNYTNYSSYYSFMVKRNGNTTNTSSKFSYMRKISAKIYIFVLNCKIIWDPMAKGKNASLRNDRM